MLPLFTTLYLLISFVLSTKRYVATFGDNGFTGSVTVDNGQVSVSLDLSSEPDFGVTGETYSSCVDGGLKWHIHKWLYDSSQTGDKLAAACGPSFTSGHIDPWNACGSASGNQYCNRTTFNYSCIPTTAYVPDYDADPFSAEVGDWSAKYGEAVLTDNKYEATYSSFYEVMPLEVSGDSVVFHCNGGARAFCAPFLESTVDASAEIPDQANGEKAVAYFNSLSDDSQIMLSADGSVQGVINATTYYATIASTSSCAEFEYTIFNAKSGGSLGDSTSLNGDACADSVDTQYDPTSQCLPWSDSDYCTNGQLCEDPDYDYNCSFLTDRYSCAPGDLSGKFGILEGDTKLTLSETGKDTLIPPIDALIGKVITIHCSYDDSNTLEILSCAKIQSYEEEGKAIQLSVLISTIISAALFMLN